MEGTAAVVRRTASRVAQNLVRLCYLTKTMLCLSVGRVVVRMGFPGKFAKGSLYLVLIRIPGNTEDLVVVGHGQD